MACHSNLNRPCFRRKDIHNHLATALATWQTQQHSDSSNMASRSIVRLRAPTVPLATMQRARSSLDLFDAHTFHRSATNDTFQQPEDTPCPPKPRKGLADRIKKLDEHLEKAQGEIKEPIRAMHSRRSKLSESVDPVLLPLKLLPQELANVHTCLKQALQMGFPRPKNAREL
jgi:hypothetical protein